MRALPLLKVLCPWGTSRIIGLLLFALCLQVWPQKWELGSFGTWRHIKQMFSIELDP